MDQQHIREQYQRPTAVIGGAGFLGGEVIRQLRTLGCGEVRVADREPWQGGGEQVRSFVGDIRTMDLAGVLAGVGTVLHLAACQYHSPLAASKYDLPFFPVNVDGTRRVVAAAKSAGAERLVFVSTNMVYGIPRALPLDEGHVTEPFGPYGKSKLAAERIVAEAHSDSFQTSVVRPGLIVGPGRMGVFTHVFEWFLRNRPAWIIGSGNNRYEMMAVEDVARLVLHVGAARDYVVYNCAAQSVPTMREWYEAIRKMAGSKSPIWGISAGPLKLGCRVLEAMRLSPLLRDQYLIADRDYYMDAKNARERLGWAPQWGGLDAILATFSWYLGARNGAGTRAANGTGTASTPGIS